MKRHAPAAARNRDAIASVLQEHLPASGTVLEVASGTGEHAAHFARTFPRLVWQPSDPDPDALGSISAWREDQLLPNLLEPIALDAAAANWPVGKIDAMVCINMIHISPPGATIGLFAAAGRILPPGMPLVTYGPYLRKGVETAPSNLAFDRGLRERDERWGLRDIDWLDELAARNGLARTALIEMPANNLALVFRRREA